MKNSILIFYFQLFGFSSCDKEDDTPAPPITAENTFSCKIDGELFIPKNHGGFISQYGYRMRILDDNSWILLLSDDKITLYFFIKEIDRIGNYEVYISDGDQDFLYDDNTVVEFRNRVTNMIYISQNNSENIEVLSYTKGQNLILKFDEIVLVSTKNPNETIVLTDGKFNINRNTLNQREP